MENQDHLISIEDTLKVIVRDLTCLGPLSRLKETVDYKIFSGKRQILSYFKDLRFVLYRKEGR